MTERPVGLCRSGGPAGCGSGNSTTASVDVSMRDTESWSGLTTQTLVPSAVIWIGPLLKDRAPAPSARSTQTTPTASATAAHAIRRRRHHAGHRTVPMLGDMYLGPCP